MSAVRCPLCGDAAVADEPLIKGQRTAEYPDIKYKPHPTGFFAVYCAFYIVVCGVFLLADKLINGGVSVSLWAIFTIPCVWALIFRPICIKKLYFGSYIFHDVVYLSALMLWLGFKCFSNVSLSVYTGIPIVLIVGAALLVLGLFLFPDHRLYSVPYLLALLLAGIILTVICAVKGFSLVLPVTAAATCAAVIIGLCAAYPKDVREELSARFVT